MLSDKLIGELEIFDISKEPEKASKLGIQSVPWFSLDDLEFHGLHSEQEIRDWCHRLQKNDAIRQYLIQQLDSGQLKQTELFISKHPAYFPHLLEIITDPDAPIQARIGTGALIEGLQASKLLVDNFEALVDLLKHHDHRVRSDACYYLGLTHHKPARAHLEQALLDDHPEVREIAQEALTELAELEEPGNST